MKPPKNPTIIIKCPVCKKQKIIDREPFDPVEAVIMELYCYECDNGGFDDPAYFDKNGKQII